MSVNRSVSLAVLSSVLLLSACNSTSTVPGSAPVQAQAVVCGVWSAAAVYVKDDTVTKGGQTFRANWWTQGEDPVANSGASGSGKVWTTIASCGVNPPPPPPPPSGLLTPGSSYSFQVLTPGFTTRFLRHSGALGATEVVTSSSADALKLDANWKTVAGLADAACYSFESVNSAGQYLRHQGSRLRIDPVDNANLTLFKNDATFCARAALDGTVGGVSLEAKNVAGSYIRHRNAELWIDPGANATVGYKQDASWKPVAPFTTTVNPPPPPPPPPPLGGIAKHALIGYWHDFNNGSGIFPVSQIPDAWDVIMIAFADSSQNGTVGFTLDPGAGSEAQFIADIRAKRAAGKKVVLSLGGANGVISVASQSDANNFANSLYALMNKYGFDGIDLDLENGVTQGAPIQTYLPIAVKALKAKVGASFYLSMAPEWVYVEGGFTTYGGIWGAYLPIIEALRGDLSILHPQYYNNGAVYTPYSPSGLAAGSTDQLVATAKMLIEGFQYGQSTFAGLRPDQVAFGVPSNSQSANSGFTTPAQVGNALDCLTKLVNCGAIRPNQAYPSFRGVMTWSINWDKFNNQSFSAPVSSKLRSLP